MVVDTKKDLELLAHLMRRAGFGATRSQIEALETKGYDAVVDESDQRPRERYYGWAITWCAASTTSSRE